MQLDILAFGAHPDDIELGASGTLIKHIKEGKKVGVVHLTRGELGTRGNADLRDMEAKKASEIMGVSTLDNLGFRDGFFVNDEKHQLAVVRMIRKYRPKYVLANAVTDRHPDHGKGANIVRNAVFLSGLPKVVTELDGIVQSAYRPDRVLHYIQFMPIDPDLIIGFDEEVMNQKMKAVEAYSSQFFDPNSDEPETIISSKNFIESVRYRAMDMGRLIGAPYGEGFTSEKMLSVNNLSDLA